MTTRYQERQRPDGKWEATIDGKTWHRLLPMSFTGPNAQKCFDGEKTQTRRLMNPQPERTSGGFVGTGWTWHSKKWPKRNSFSVSWTEGEEFPTLTPGRSIIDGARYRIGEFFYIREPWRTNSGLDNVKPSLLTDAAPIGYEGERTQGYWNGKLRPAMFLQRRFARPARYRVTAVRCERVNSISEADAAAEGCKPENYTEALNRGEYLGTVNRFALLWDSIHKEAGTRFADAPWVFAYTFRRIAR